VRRSSNVSRKRKLRPDWFCFFDGHVPAIGDGWRAVAVVKIGTKWAHLCATGTQELFRVRLDRWENIRKRPIIKGKIIFDRAAVPLVKPLVKRPGRKS
jgi:hypothetical protein